MKNLIRVLYGLLLVALLLTTLELIRWMDLPTLLDDKVDPDEKYAYLGLMMILVVYIYTVFLEIELFVGLRYILLGIERKRVLVIIFSALLLLSALAGGILGILADKYSSRAGIDFTGWLLAIPAEIVVLDLILLLLPKSKIEERQQIR